MQTGSTCQPGHLRNWSWSSLFAREERQVYNRSHALWINLNLSVNFSVNTDIAQCGPV